MEKKENKIKLSKRNKLGILDEKMENNFINNDSFDIKSKSIINFNKNKEIKIKDEKRDIVRYNIKIKAIYKYNYIIMIKLLILIYFLLIKCKGEIITMLEYKNSKIRLKIRGKGYKYIFSTNLLSKYYPKEIYINWNKQYLINSSYYFNEIDNFIELIWDNNINNCINIFRQCEDITEIDLSNFDTSEVTDMSSMFYGCSSLKSLELSSFDTSNVANMRGMLYNCSSLSSLNLSNFNTSHVTNMLHMFYGCSSLSSINLFNFNIPNLIDMSGIFFGCKNLGYIYLKNLNTFNLYYWDLLFGDLDNVVICINEYNTTNILFSQIIEKKCQIIECSDNLESKQKQIINDSDCLCKDNCDNNTKYKYDYNRKFYKNYNNNGIINKYELQKFLLCPSDTLSKNLCIKCSYNYDLLSNIIIVITICILIIISFLIKYFKSKNNNSYIKLNYDDMNNTNIINQKLIIDEKNKNQKIIMIIKYYIYNKYKDNDFQDLTLENLINEIYKKYKEKINKKKIKKISYMYIKDKLLENLTCPISQDIFINPYITPEGQTFNKYYIDKYIEIDGKNPLTKLPLEKRDLILNKKVLDLLELYDNNKNKFNKTICNELKNILKNENGNYYNNPIIIEFGEHKGETTEGNNNNNRYINLIIKSLIDQIGDLLEEDFKIFDEIHI